MHNSNQSIFFHKVGKWVAGIIAAVIASVLTAVIVGKIQKDIIKQENRTDTIESIDLDNQPVSSWKLKGGTWKVSGKQIYGQGSFNINKAFFIMENFTNFTYEVRLRKLPSGNEPIGLIMRYDEQRDEGYMFLLWPHGDYQFSRLVDQTRHSLGSGTPKALNKGNLWNSVKVIGIGTQLKVYINGDLQANFEDDAYSFGRLGLVIHGGPDQRAEFEILSMNSF